MTKTVRKPGVIWIKMNHHNPDVYIALFFFFQEFISVLVTVLINTMTKSKLEEQGFISAYMDQ